MFQLHIQNCSRDDVEQLNQELENTSALSITLTDKQDDPILEPELGTTPLWPHVVIHALYAEEIEGRLAMELLASTHPHLSMSLEPLVDKDWERVCMDDFKPLRFGQKLWICPTWTTPPEANAVNLILDPGLAFGTGTHPTTYLCLTWLEQAELQQKKLIDYGCGSGVLALAALKLGASHVDAVDIDAQALIATQQNAINNELSPTQLTVNYPDILKHSVDIIIANILLSPLLSLQNRFHELLKQGGQLVVSGILHDQVEGLIDAYQEKFVHKKTTIHEGWALLEFTMPKQDT